MRFVWIALMVVCVLAGALFGALNGDSAGFDFYVFQTELPKGAALLSAFLVGWITAGSIVWLAVALPLKRRIARSQRDAARRDVVRIRNDGQNAGTAGDA